MPVSRATGIVAALAPLVLLTACSSSSSSGTSTVESSASSLVAIGPPTSEWVPADSEVLSAVVAPDGQRTTVVDEVPVLLRADANGSVTDAATGWMRRVAAPQAMAACRETEHWVALAEEKYGLVSMSDRLTVPESCGMSNLSTGEGSPIAGECSPAVKGADSTCMYVGADPVDGGQVRVTAILVRSHIPA